MESAELTAREKILLKVVGGAIGEHIRQLAERLTALENEVHREQEQSQFLGSIIAALGEEEQ